ncbi:MAG: FAD-binding oxidoreductase [Actinomycetota bacterium]|nr:FAD-binding oxidoreductase [Actinomycetota bacterium]
MTERISELARKLKRVVGDTHVLEATDLTLSYATDWTGRFRGHTPIVVRPADTSELAQVVTLTGEAELKIVPQGGNTGLVGGGVPLNGEVVLSTTRLDQCEPVDQLAQQVTLGAGVTLARAQAHVAPSDLDIGVDLAARDSCTIGGMIATNAGGINVLRYGAMRDQLLGLEAVLADGSIISHLEGLEKDNTGYHFPSLFAGSEGTLGIITKARLRLHPHMAERCTAMLAFSTVDDAVAATSALRRSVPSLHAVEVVFRAAMHLVSEHIDSSIPVGPKSDAWLIVEAAASSDPTEELAAAIDKLGTLVTDVGVALDGQHRNNLWQYREKVTEAISVKGTPHKLDVTLGASKLAEFVHQVPSVVSEQDEDASVYMFGHLGDGNVHVNVLGKDGSEPSELVDEAVLEYVAKLGGSISAEHGVGSAKRDLLHLNRSHTEISAFRLIKHALDPHRVLNPHVLLPKEDS